MGRAVTQIRAVTPATAQTPLQITCPRRSPEPPAITAKTPKNGLEITADISPARPLRTARNVTAGRPQEARRSAKRLAPAGVGRYARPMEISPNWGNFPRLRVQVPLGHVKSPRAAVPRHARPSPAL